MTAPDVAIQAITASQTHALRRTVLRDGMFDADVEWEGDDEPTTFHLGAVADGRIMAIATWLVLPDPLAPALRSVRLRGMATEPEARGRGLGRALLDSGISRARDDGHDRIWANARVTALGFYRAAGLVVSGPVFETADTGVAHRHVHVDLT